jgi:DNA-binding HxlR family transcriptional regulator
MAQYGVERMISELNPKKKEYHDGEIIIHKPHCGEQNITLDGQGVIFVPKALRQATINWQVACPWLPMVIYGARGGGTLYHSPAQSDPEMALTMMIGEGRAKVLESLKTPLHTAELAQRLQVTAGAISQHLGKLSQAGLVTSHRSSSKVYYRLTPRGEKLLAVFTE